MDIKKIIFLFISALSVSTSFGQYYDTEFGHNRIQYKILIGCTIPLAILMFIIMMKQICQEAIDYLEEEFNRLTDVLGYALALKLR